MCGRFVLAHDPGEYIEHFRVDEIRVDYLRPSFNVAPTSRIYGVRDMEGTRVLEEYTWGFLPFWAKTPAKGIINARVETIATKATFKNSFLARRCIVPADGYYEWQVRPRGKLPHFIRLRDDTPMGIAGIRRPWTDPETGDSVETCALITTDAYPSLQAIHHRMPLVLDESLWDAWLDPETDPETLLDLLRSVPESAFRFHPVSTLVNNVRNNVPECLRPLPQEALFRY